MAIQPEHVVLTYSDYLQLPSDRNRYELLQGELQVNPAPGTGHQTVVTNLAAILRDHVRPRHLGMVLVAPCDVLLTDITVVQPDVLFVSRERQAIVLSEHVRGAPDLVVEVLSPSTARADRHVKRQLYARYGVPHYWLLEPIQREAVAHSLVERIYQEIAAARGNETFAAPPFPELAIPLSELWD